MPHFIIECNESLLNKILPKSLIQNVYDSAESTGLFGKGDIKVRINSYNFYNVGNTQEDFIHVFGNIMQGRTDAQKKNLSEKIIKNLKPIFPEIRILSSNIREFEKASYCNTSMV